MSSPDCQSTARHHAPGPVPLVFGFGLEVMGIEGGILRIGVVENGIMLEDFAPEASTFEEIGRAHV